LAACLQSIIESDEKWCSSDALDWEGKMAIYMIGYDLHPSKGETYDDLTDTIEELFPTHWHCLDSTWLVKTVKTAVQIRDALKPHLKNDDQLLVMKYGKGAAWFGFKGDCKTWLKNNL
jgi:hypothetical protein